MALTVQDLIANPPKLHDHAGVLIAGWKLADEELRFIEQHVHSGMKTLETGSGLSTILFAIKGTRHTCITPNTQETVRIKSYCDQHGISHAGIRFITERSENVLPGLQERDYDFALIDGRHGFPTPFLDWYYVAAALRPHGIVMIDDLHIWTVEVLTQFLLEEQGWSLVAETGRAATFRKLDDSGQERDWDAQPFVFRRSRPKSLAAQVRYLASIARRRDLPALKRIITRLPARLGLARGEDASERARAP